MRGLGRESDCLGYKAHPESMRASKRTRERGSKTTCRSSGSVNEEGYREDSKSELNLTSKSRDNL